MKSFAKNYFLNLAYQLLVVLLPLVTAPYIARVLGAEQIGAYSFAQSIVSYFTMFAVMGTTLYGQRQIATCYARKENLKQPFAELILLRGIGVIVAFSVYFTFVFPLADKPILYFVASIEILTVVFDISWFYQGIERFEKITLCNGISKLLSAVGIFLFVKSQQDLELYVVFSCGAILIGNVFQWFYLRPYLQEYTLSHLVLWKHVKPALSLFISQFAIQAYTVLDKTMIGLITGSDSENGYYDQAQKLIRALIAVTTSIGTVMASRIAILWNSPQNESRNQVRAMLLFSFRLVFALSLPISVGTMIIASRFVPFFYGDGYGPVVIQIQLLATLLPIISCSNVIGTQLFVPSGREQLLTRSVMVGAGVNVLLNSIYIPSWGASGAVFASIIAELVVTGIQMYMARRELPILQIIKLFAHYLVLTVIMGIAGCALSVVVNADAGGMFVIIVVCMILYAGMLLLRKDPVLHLFSM